MHSANSILWDNNLVSRLAQFESSQISGFTVPAAGVEDSFLYMCCIL